MTNPANQTPATARTPLRPLDEALAELLAQALPLAGSQSVSTFDADGRVLTEDLLASLNVPGHDNSSMDGYAVRVADLAASDILQVTQRIAAGSTGHALEPMAAARIFTGAPVPPGADAVVMQEDTEALDGLSLIHI